MRNFEKYLQEKADSFDMNPLPDSFDKVMAALEKKKKRRFLFWLWLIIPGFAIGSSFVVYKSFSWAGNKTIVENKTNEVQNSTRNSKRNTNTSTHLNNIPVTTTNLQNNNDGKSTQQTFVENEVKNAAVKINKESNKTSEKKKTNTIENKDQSIQKSFNSHDKFSNGNIEDHSNNGLNHTNIESPFVKNIIEPGREKSGFVMGVNNLWMPVFGKIEHRSIYFRKQDVPSVQPYDPEFRIAKRKKFSIGVYSDLGVSKSNFFSNVPQDSTPKGYYSTARGTADKFLFSYSAGLQFRYSPVKFFSIETGIGFSHYESYQVIANSGISTSGLMDQNEPDTVLSFATYSSPSNQEYYNIYDYICIPIKLFYQNRWNKIGIEAGGGIVFDIPVNTRSYAADENTGASYLKKEVNGSRLNMFGIQAVANVNFVFHIRSFSIFGGPTFKYRINSMFDDQYIIQQRPFFIGGQIGARYNF